MKESIGLLLVRIAFGIRLIYGTIDNVLSWDRMVEFQNFLTANHFPFPLLCAVISVYAQFLAGICWIIGFYSRIASIVMVINFLVAIIGFHLMVSDTYINTAPAIHLLVISLLLFLAGPGKYSINNK